jgi:hypothetical protein
VENVKGPMSIVMNLTDNNLFRMWEIKVGMSDQFICCFSGHYTFTFQLIMLQFYVGPLLTKLLLPVLNWCGSNTLHWLPSNNQTSQLVWQQYPALVLCRCSVDLTEVSRAFPQFHQESAETIPWLVNGHFQILYNETFI